MIGYDRIRKESEMKIPFARDLENSRFMRGNGWTPLADSTASTRTS